MKPILIIELKTSGSYFVTSVKCLSVNFWHNDLMLPRSSIISQKYRPFIEVIKDSPLGFFSTISYTQVSQNGYSRYQMRLAVPFASGDAG